MTLTTDIATNFIEHKRQLGLKSSSLSSYSYTLYSKILPLLPSYIELIEHKNINNILLSFKNETNKNNYIILNEFCKFIYSYNDNYLRNFFNFTIPKSPKPKIDVFKDTEQKQLLEYLLQNFNNFSFGILLALTTGIRVGELSALQFKDFSKNYFSISRTLQRVKDIEDRTKKKTKIIIDKPKSFKSIREIPLPNFLANKIDLLNKEGVDCYVLTGTKCYIEPRTVERKFKKILEKCEIEYRKFHTLRHTFATNAIKQNLETKILCEILGHSSIKTTLDLYVHIDIETKTEFINKMFITTKTSQN